VQKALGEVAKEMQPVVLKLAAELDADLLEKLKRAGMQVNEADRDAFVAASGAIYREFAAAVPEGQALIDKAMSLRGGP
jgi:TRAP-type transport system periplasmic protein